ncbi:MAG: hypothetical protein AB1554_01180, partial [Chloroflexota bacterium]
EIQIENNKLADQDDFDEEEPQEIPAELKSVSPEKLAQELVAFAKAETDADNDEPIYIHQVADYFWRSKNIEKWELPVDLEMKVEKAERIADQLLEKEQQERTEKRLEKENAELPALVDDCMKWAQQKGFKKVTHADIDAYLMKKKINIHYETRRNLYATVNVELKAVKK